MEKKILVVKKEPGKAPVVDNAFDNSLKSFQQAVEGYIETVTFSKNFVVICNEEGRLLDLPYNTTLFGIDFYGTIVIAGTEDEDFASLRSSGVPMVLKLLKEEK